jgi:3-oxoacyl-[acyl-carrier protein] reductase
MSRKRSGALQGKVVCITGASRGLGAALARAFGAEGANLVLGARTLPDLEQLASELGDAVVVQTDVQQVEDLRRLIDAAMAEFGRLDVMINNAGLAIYGPFEGVSERDFDTMIATNLKGTFFGSQLAFQIMKAQRSGLIINVSSIAGKLHLPMESAYNASKWAVNGFTGTLRLEAQPYNVKVTCVCPGGIHTPFWASIEQPPFPVDRIEPARDFMAPEEVARTIVQIALASDRYVVPEVVMVPLLPQL